MRTMSRVIRSTIALSMLMVSPASVFSQDGIDVEKACTAVARTPKSESSSIN